MSHVEGVRKNIMYSWSLTKFISRIAIKGVECLRKSILKISQFNFWFLIYLQSKIDALPELCVHACECLFDCLCVCVL